MPGTITGGKKAAARNMERHGPDFYKRIGAIGGAKGTTGGFSSNEVGSDGLTGRQRAMYAGRKGGQISRRKKVTGGMVA